MTAEPTKFVTSVLIDEIKLQYRTRLPQESVRFKPTYVSNWHI